MYVIEAGARGHVVINGLGRTMVFESSRDAWREVTRLQIERPGWETDGLRVREVAIYKEGE